ncbi:hypothetical protein UFOVP650_17 [uncultured Caudovirales phage]|uniref:Uncharacterized protein n=1 Tax=uncultured Caudovirales phage TaxID=2100421 RepID=A0A6J5N971_9CAUD|nr:hypothetical protein UFOVP650_17 [uncultured Caudovirales phage]
MPDPRSAPQSVPDNAVIRVPDSLPGSGQAPQTLVVALEGTATQTATVQPWVLDEGGNPSSEAFANDPTAARAGRKWYKYGAALTVTVGEAQTLTAVAGSATTIKMPCPTGRIYLQVTTHPAANATLKAGYLGAGA